MAKEAATAHWFPTEADRPVRYKPEPSKDRKFASVDKAVKFLMEQLSAIERSKAHIRTSSRYLSIDDIERILRRSKGVARSRSPAPVNPPIASMIRPPLSHRALQDPPR
jgi:hypothetical protein